MTGCSAINCAKRSDNGVKMFVIPTNVKDPRRSKWIINSRRKDWTPNRHSYFCEKHFEESQFEIVAGVKKLRKNAIPTLFEVPNPPPKINKSPRKSEFKRNLLKINNVIDHGSVPTRIDKPRDMDLLNISPDSNSDFIELSRVDYIAMKKDYNELQKKFYDLKKDYETLKTDLEAENSKLKQQLEESTELISKLVSEDQLTLLKQGRVNCWTNESIIKALKYRFALAVHGYNFLRSTGFPLPCYSTLTKRLQSFQIDYGVFHVLSEPLKVKAESMAISDRFCVLSYDEMTIASQLDVDKNKKKFHGYITIYDSVEIGTKLFVVLARGIRTNWKQIIACHVTKQQKISFDIMKNFLFECISFLESCGIHVLALSSDMDSRNIGTWIQLGIEVNQLGTRINSFELNGREVFVMPDVCHLLKNLKAALLRQFVILPLAFVEEHELPCEIVNGSLVKKLFDKEIAEGQDLRRFYHLTSADMDPDAWEKMNVGAAIRFFSIQTASALECAAKEGELLEAECKEAITTAAFIRLVEEWFSLINSRMRKASITLNNQDRKFIFLHQMVDLFQNIKFGGDKWKPLNKGMILANLSFCDLAEYLFSQDFDFVLGHRFSQDATENVFSQIRKKEGKMPTSRQCLRAIKLISVGQFISDIDRTNYCSDNDRFLLDFFHKNSSNNDIEKKNEGRIFMTKNIPEPEISILTFDFMKNTLDIRIFRSVYYLAGCCIHAIQHRCCETCQKFMKADNLPKDDFFSENGVKLYALQRDRKTALIHPAYEIFYLITHCEIIFKENRAFILRNSYDYIIRSIIFKVDIKFPSCCSAKEKLVKHYFTIRSFAVKNFSENCKKRKIVYGTASQKRKKN